MYNVINIFLVGMSISFAGALPLGNLNVTATQIAATESRKQAWYFAIGAASVEIVYVRLSLAGLRQLVLNSQWFLALQWLAVVVFLVLGIASVRAARSTSVQQPVVLRQGMHRFFLGTIMSALNPAQFPFWIGWSSYLITKKILSPGDISFNWFTAGIGTGTIAALGLFIVAGSKLIRRYQWGERVLQWVMAAVFLVSAGVQAYRLVWD